MLRLHYIERKVITISRLWKFALLTVVIGPLLFITSCNKDVYNDPGNNPTIASWHMLNTLPIQVSLNSVYFRDDLSGFAVGDSGIMMKTTDGGNTWNFSYQFPGYQLFKIKFATSQAGWICGSKGLLRYTQDGGNTWTAKNLGTQASFHDLFFSGDRGWVVGSADYDTTASIWYTTDKGVTWTKQLSGTHSMLRGVCCIDSLGWAVGFNGSVIATYNWGEQWDSLHSGTLKNLKQVVFRDKQNGVAVGESGTLLMTNDGGQNWTVGTALTYYNLSDIYFFNFNHGWIAGDNGKIFTTTDSGKSWSPENTGVTGNISQVFFTGLLNGYAVGTDIYGRGFILRYN
ncbi:MAG: YCF48-related protein [Bacteroidetes bacterium]|nr:YCF48-related protein [Bacteroidota bacterium]